MSKSWASTLRLPKSTFPPRPLPQNRDQYIRRCADELYKWQAANRPADDEFVLHDGPPYANGSLHAGHALNKILKDMILRVKIQQGRRVSYVPGWDCHGLPIELKAVDVAAGKSMSPGAIRKAARKLAAKTVTEQMKAFRTYGVMADWDARWTTMDMAYEVRQLRLFQRMVRRGLVYRRYKPVYWSPSSGTALAEAELEYNEAHVSKAAYVRFPVVGGHEGLPGLDRLEGRLYAVIWTTTPWTLPANRAIAVHDELTYHVVRAGQDAFLVAETCLERVARVLPGAPEVLATVKGSELTRLRYVNVLRGRSAEPQPFMHGDFVTDGSGSGLVHCAPGHGFDDYLACLPRGIPVSAPVDSDGRFTDEAFPDRPDRLRGISVLDGGSSAVLEILGDDVLDVHDYRHKYPYDWRTKQPIIIRATAQWFADVGTIKDAALAAIGKVRFVPENAKNRLEAFVKSRSEWCISRQRAWGVPIPALYEPDGNAVMTDKVIDHIISVIRERGTDAWWTDAPDDPAWIPEALRGRGQYSRGRDTMDVWFDSGTSWTMMGDKQADLYLEGSDQHRGWFQSSLLTRVAAAAADADHDGGRTTGSTTTDTLGLSPFKTLVTHGFTLDKDGKKMSKSLGNIISADQVMDGSLLPPLKPKKKKSGNAAPVKDALGPDALRLWVASSDYTRDIVLGEPVLKTIHQALLKYRTTIKMLTGSMHRSARTAPLTAVDEIALLQLSDVMDEVGRHYDAHEFNKAFGALNRWLANDLSAFYLEALKDRLYCADGGGVLEPIFVGFLRMLAPVAPLLVEEAWEHRPQWLKDDDPDALHPLRQLYRAPLIDPARLTRDPAELREAVPVLMAAHAAIKAASEPARADKVLGSSLQCHVVLEVPEEGRALRILRAHEAELPAMFVVSSVELNGAVGGEEEEEEEEEGWKYCQRFELDGQQCKAWVLPPRQAKCPRCWRYVAPSEDELCGRCEEVVGQSIQ
ncbi:tRNA synthetases class I-domain-containing protein [Thermothelomyces heterothallicus CBS 202.75]|uniref:tRNA synthetases class I-domain-containing protein n=1 Tax=Thermothelomyces heterothallicus CBS 202.75 TaxID=1149848 RepID=UPI003744A5D5